MRKLLTGLLLAAVATLSAKGEELTLNFADLGLDNGALLTDYKVNDNLTITSTGTWNESNQDYRLFSGGSFTVTITDATLTGVNITCNSGHGFSVATVTADSQTSVITTDPFSWTGEATESWSVTATTPANINVRMESITFTYSPKAVSETLTAEFLSKDMGVSGGESMPEGGYEANEFVSIDFAQGSHASKPTYNESANAFYLFNGQQVVVSAKNGAKLLKIEVATPSSNPFGFMTTVTADGTAQTNGNEFTLDPVCEWNGVAEQNVIFENEGRTGNTRVTGITVTYQTPGEGLVIARPEIIPADSDNTVVINCATEGASIYYTLDGTDPTEEDGTLYENPFTISEACTVRAAAFMDGSSSTVASLNVYMKIVDSLKAFLANKSPETVTIDCPVTAILTQGSYLMVKDNKGSFAIIRNIDSSLNDALNVENGTTWSNITATFEPYGDYGYVQPVELGEVSKGDAVEPKVVALSEFDNCVPFEYVSLQCVSVERTGSYLTFTDGDENELDGYMRFAGISIPEAESDNPKYDVTGFASNDPEELELWPVSFVVNANSGVAEINADSNNAIYFNTQGIRVEHPVKGSTYIVVCNGKANKVMIR